MAALKSLLIVMCSLGVASSLSMMEGKTGKTIWPFGSGKKKKSGPLTLADVEKQLGNVNDTMDIVSEMVATVNSTAYDMLDTFLSSTDSFATILGKLQEAASAAEMLPDGDELAKKVTGIIAKANSSLKKASAKLPATLTTVEKKATTDLPAIQKIADSLMSQFMEAAQNVLSLSNLTDSTTDSSLAKKATEPEHDEKSKKGREGKTKKRNGKHSKKKLALLQERALSDTAVSSSVTVDRSISQKGGGSPCTKALSSVIKANKTLSKMALQVQKYNGTAYALLGQVVDTAASSLSSINSTVSPALDAAEDTVPASTLSPVTKGLTKLLSVVGDLTSVLKANLKTIQGMESDAQKTMSTVYKLSEDLVDAVTTAQCAGACGEKEKDACESA